VRRPFAPARLVLDASIALAWCFDDEASPATEALLDQVKTHGAVVPTLWHLELGNVLLAAERRGRTIEGGIVVRLSLFARLPIEIDVETSGRAWRETLVLARAERLTLYDSAYLELAVRRGLPLATRDQDLAAAAKRVAVAILP
jgi:predicted nucleic acid-binding protein